MVKKITATTSSFRKIIEKKSLYVDKTRVIYELLAAASTDDAYYFLARPRRFGKTLLISTLKELFLGNRELFKGLWIDSSDYKWERYPVISLNFSTLDSSSSQQLKESLGYDLDLLGKEHSIDLSKTSNPGSKLKTLVLHLAQINKVVILIDEYDYPVVHTIHNVELFQGNLAILSDFFTSIKGIEESLYALFITGVTQIPKASIFSGMNLLNNISFDPVAATLLGYTKEEVITYFSEHISRLAVLEKKSDQEILTEIQLWYNGYQFSEQQEKVYNPFSLHYLFTKNKFANYWFNSATPSFLLELLKKKNYIVEKIEEKPFSQGDLSTLVIEDPGLAPLLFQTGYLTIASYDSQTSNYTLTYPNKEVRESYNLSLLGALTRKTEASLNDLRDALQKALVSNDMDLLCDSLKTIFGSIPYQIDKRDESFYHSTLQTIIRLVGFKADSEVSTNKGRIDMVVRTPHFIYIFELKVDRSGEVALKQIEDSRYYERYLNEGLPIVLVGLVFNKRKEEPSVSCRCKVISSKSNAT